MEEIQGKYYRVKVHIRLIKRSLPLMVISALACISVVLVNYNYNQNIYGTAK